MQVEIVDLVVFLEIYLIILLLIFQVPKLVEGVHYLFRVAAENAIGVSRFLEADKPTMAKNPYGKIKCFNVITSHYRSIEVPFHLSK